MITFELRKGEEFIPLIQLLKAANLVESGAEAQAAVSEGLVQHNGETELRKRAKCRPSDTVVFRGETITIAAPQP